MIEYATEFAAILKTSLSTTQAVKRLGVHAARQCRTPDMRFLTD
jgi:hypothetical protein